MYSFDDDDDEIKQKHHKKFIFVEAPTSSNALNLNSVPTSPMEYLQCVMLERKQCPKIVRADMDPQKFSSNQSVLFQNNSAISEKIPNEHFPSATWKKIKIRLFSENREKVLKQKDMLQEKCKDYKSLLPPIDNSLDWCAFCLGKNCVEQVGEVESPFDTALVNYAEHEKYDSGKGYSPGIRFVIHLSVPDIIKLLAYHTFWLEHLGFSHRLGEWIVALLTCLEEPLFPDTAFVLRQVVNVCSKTRIQIKDKQDPTLQSLNYIISIISIYFKQKDMEDPNGPEEG